MHQGDIVVKQLDLSDLASVDKFTEEFLATEMGPHLLILNAGIMACPQGYTKDGFEMQIGASSVHSYLCRSRVQHDATASSYDKRNGCDVQNTIAGTNHFGHFALTRNLLPSIRSLVRIISSTVLKGLLRLLQIPRSPCLVRVITPWR